MRPRKASGSNWGRLGGVLGALGLSEGLLGRSWGPLGAILGPLGKVWGPLVAILEPLGRVWGPLGAVLGPLGASWSGLLGACWHKVTSYNFLDRFGGPNGSPERPNMEIKIDQIRSQQ